MEVDLIETLVKYRMAVGYLGEKSQFGWWQSSFLTPEADAFLSPLFPRTQLLAQCNGVTRAAAIIHDERIGIGHVYHLFRLPEELEQGIHQRLHDPDLVQELQKSFASKETALSSLRRRAVPMEPKDVGPTRVGNIAALREPRSWLTAASLYLAAFESKQLIFPYFSDAA